MLRLHNAFRFFYGRKTEAADMKRMVSLLLFSSLSTSFTE
jgi:hypothetical protein